jgi:hypothetical protein
MSSSDSVTEYALERAENYVQCYLPLWAKADWTDSDTQFLAQYLAATIADAPNVS